MKTKKQFFLDLIAKHLAIIAVLAFTTIISINNVKASHGPAAVSDIDYTGMGTFTGSYTHSTSDHVWIVFNANAGNTISFSLSTAFQHHYWLYKSNTGCVQAGNSTSNGCLSLVQNGGNGATTNTYTYTVSATGQYAFQLDAYIGQSGSYSVTISGSSATTSLCTPSAPSFTSCPSNITSCNAGVINYTATASSGTLTYSKSGATSGSGSGTGSGTTFNTGTTNVIITASSCAGTTTCAFTVTVGDTEKPNITCPSNQTIDLDANCSATLPDYRSLLSVSDNCSSTLTITQSPAPNTSINSTGNMSITFTVTDVSNNSNTCSISLLKKDVTAPTITCPQNISVDNDANICGAMVTYNLPSFSDNCNSSAGVHTLNYGEKFFDYANNTYEYQYSPGLPMTFNPTDGTKMAVFLQIGSSTHYLYQDVTMPSSGSMQLGFDLQYKNHSGSFSSNQFVAVEIRKTSDNSLLQTLFKTVSGDPLSTSMTHYSYDLSAYAGQTIRLEMVDATINNYFFDVFLDNVTLAGSSLANGSFETGDYSNWNVYSSYGPYGTWGIGSAANVTLTQISGQASGSTFPVGTTTNTFKATDLSGNTSTCSFTVVVKDTEAPTLTCPGNITKCGAQTVTFAASATDNCGNTTITYSPASGSNFDVGTTTVTATATDDANNTSECTFDVVINPNPTCSISVTPSNNTYTGGNPRNIYLGYGPQSATMTANATGGSGFTYSWSPSTYLSDASIQNPVFTPTAEGNYTYTVTITNSNGCSTTCSVTFCVKDVNVTGKGGSGKVYLCHVPPGNSSNAQTLSISVNAVPSHLSEHSGDALGKCGATCNNNKRTIIDELVVDIENLEITCSPNPFSQSFKLNYISSFNSEATISVYGITGNLLEQTHVSGNSNQVELGNNLPAGIYTVSFNQGELVKVFKMIKVN